MEYAARPPLAGDPMRHVSANARLPLADDRAAEVAALMDMVNGLVDTLDSLDLAEVPPATAFNARWE